MTRRLSQSKSELIFASADIYFAGTRALFDTFYVFFASQILNLPLTAAGLIYSIGLITRATAEPLFGMISDHIETRWGKRKPFFVIGVPLVLLSFLALWFPYQLSGTPLFIVGLCSTLFYGLVAGAMMSPYAALSPDLVKDYHGRTRLGNIRHIFELLTLTVTLVTFSQFFSGKFNLHGPVYLGTLLGFSLLFTAPIVLLALFIPEPASQQTREPWPVLFKRLTLPFRVSYFDNFIVMNACIDTVFILLPALFPFYLKFYLHSFELLPVYAVSLGLGAFLAIFMMMKVGKTWCKIIIFRISVALAILVILGLNLLPPNNQIFANALFFCLGIVVAGTSSSRLSMLTDLAQVVSERFNTSCQATVFAMAKVVAQSLAGVLMMVIFQLTDLRHEGVEVPIDGGFVKALLVYPCLIMLTLALIFAFLYNLNEKNLKQL